MLRVLRRLKHYKTRRWAGQPIVPEPWQLEYVVKPIFGWKNPDGTRIINTAWIEVPRKNGKSTITSGLGIYLWAADQEPGAEVYAAAADKDQARIVFQAARVMAEACKPLKRKHPEILRDALVLPRTQSIFRVLSGIDTGKMGFNVHAALIDEVHEHKKRDLIDALETGTGSRDQPLVLFITTADEGGPGTIYDEKRVYAEQIAKRLHKDPSFYAVIYAAEEKDDPFARETWAKANPSLGVTLTESYIAKQANRAKVTPAYLAKFKRLHLGLRTKEELGWLGIDKWDLAGGTSNMVDEEQLRGCIAVGGLDLANVADLAALCWTFPPAEDDENEPYEAIWRFWLPEARLEDLNARTNGEARVWAKEGFITLTPGDLIDHKAIKAQTERDLVKFDVPKTSGIAYDRWGMTQLQSDLADAAGNEDFVYPMGQGFASMSAPTKEWESLILQKRYKHGGNPVMRWMFDNIAVQVDPALNVKLDRKRSRDKIDGCVAAVMSLDCWLRQPKQRSRSLASF